MSIKFYGSNEQTNPIAICMIDVTDICQSAWAKSVAVNLSDYLIQYFVKKTHDVYIDINKDLLLKEVSLNQSYTHAVVIASATSLAMDSGDNLSNEIRQFCNDTKFSIAKDLLDPKSEYQFHIVNLNDYRDLNYPNIIVDIGPAIKSCKDYMYYESDSEFLKHASKLYDHAFMASNIVHALNSEQNVLLTPEPNPLDQYITVGTGFNWISQLESLGYTEETEVVFTDINYNCLMFMKAMITEWDGKNYGEFYKEFMKPFIHLLPSSKLARFNSYCQHSQMVWEEFKWLFDDWHRVWNKIRKLRYSFRLVDFTASNNYDWIMDDKNVFINLSDLFTYSPFAFSHSIKYKVSQENRLIEDLQRRNPNISIKFGSRAADHFTQTPLRKIGKISDINYTDICSLKKPAWHLEDWNDPVITT